MLEMMSGDVDRKGRENQPNSLAYAADQALGSYKKTEDEGVNNKEIEGEK